MVVFSFVHVNALSVEASSSTIALVMLFGTMLSLVGMLLMANGYSSKQHVSLDT
jgi:hypothetical protein